MPMIISIIAIVYMKEVFLKQSIKKTPDDVVQSHFLDKSEEQSARSQWIEQDFGTLFQPRGLRKMPRAAHNITYKWEK